MFTSRNKQISSEAEASRIRSSGPSQICHWKHIIKRPKKFLTLYIPSAVYKWRRQNLTVEPFPLLKHLLFFGLHCINRVQYPPFCEKIDWKSALISPVWRQEGIVCHQVPQLQQLYHHRFSTGGQKLSGWSRKAPGSRRRGVRATRSGKHQSPVRKVHWKILSELAVLPPSNLCHHTPELCHVSRLRWEVTRWHWHQILSCLWIQRNWRSLDFQDFRV